jgi:predicted small secreted protein
VKLKLWVISGLLLSMAFLAGCENTVQGFGQDMQHTGKAIQKSVNN